MTKKITVTLTQKQAEMTLSAIGLMETMYEQGDMDGMSEPVALAGEHRALRNARSSIYAAGFEWSE